MLILLYFYLYTYIFFYSARNTGGEEAIQNVRGVYTQNSLMELIKVSKRSDPRFDEIINA